MQCSAEKGRSVCQLDLAACAYGQATQRLHHAVVMQGMHGRVSVYCPLTNVLLEASGSGPG
jgi:hypothetical protein